jgi:hypothetical protein
MYKEPKSIPKIALADAPDTKQAAVVAPANHAQDVVVVRFEVLREEGEDDNFILIG